MFSLNNSLLRNIDRILFIVLSNITRATPFARIETNNKQGTITNQFNPQQTEYKREEKMAPTKDKGKKSKRVTKSDMEGEVNKGEKQLTTNTQPKEEKTDAHRET